MKYDSGVNEVQALIMRRLFTNGVLRFSEINTEGFPSDQFSYHLRQLTKNGIIEKLDDNRYQLSITGKGRAILLDSHSNKFIEQGFVACRVVLAQDFDGVKKYVMQKRKRVPLWGYLADPGGKILFGEDILDAAGRNMLVETGLTCDMEVKGLAHFKDSYLGSVVQDKYFFVIEAKNPTGKLLPHGPTGDNLWMTLDEIQAYPKVHQGLLDLIAIAGGDNFGFKEVTHVTEDY